MDLRAFAFKVYVCFSEFNTLAGADATPSLLDMHLQTCEELAAVVKSQPSLSQASAQSQPSHSPVSAQSQLSQVAVKPTDFCLFFHKNQTNF